MPSRVTIFDHDGTGITELDTATTRSWILNDVGRCQFNLATFGNPKCQRDILQYGNFITVEHLSTRDYLGVTHGTLPPWIGILLPPQEWSFGSLIVTAYSAEALLSYRPMPYRTMSGPAGALFSAIIDAANDFGTVPLQPGQIWSDGPNFTQSFRLSAYEEIRNLSKHSAQDWNVTYSNVSGQLTLYANWYSQLGDTVNQVFSEGGAGNMRLPGLVEQGALVNVVNGYNTANSASTRLSSQQIDTDSSGDYGALGMNVNFSVNGQAGLNYATLSYLNTHSRPAYSLELTALDNGKTFDNLDVGAVWDVNLTSVGFYGGGVGFQGTTRILGMEYDDRANECKLTTQTLTAGLTKENYA